MSAYSIQFLNIGFIGAKRLIATLSYPYGGGV